MAPLEAFSEPTRTWFGAAFAEPTAAQEGAWQAIGAGRHALVVAPTGSGKTLSAFLWSIDRLLTREVPEKAKRCRVLYVSPLKALAVDVERNLRAPLTGIRQTAERLGQSVPELRVGVRSGRHQRRRPAQAGHHTARHPDHHPRVAVPDADQPGPRVAARRRDRDRRRGARRRRHQARRPPRRQPRAARRPAREAGSADRAQRHRAPAGGGGEVPRRPGTGRHRGAGLGEAVGPQGRRTRRGHDRAGAVRRRGGRRPEPQPVDLAPRRGARRRPDRTTPLHDRLRQLPSARGAAHGPAERDRERAAGDRPRATGADHGAVRGLPRREPGDREGAPRVGVQGAAGADRGRPQARTAALRGRHQQPRARHRHGRGRPGDPDRVAAERGQRAAARGPGRPPGGRDQPRGAVPQAPRRPRPDRGGRRADAVRRDRVAAGAGQPARRPRPAGGRVDRARGVGRR